MSAQRGKRTKLTDRDLVTLIRDHSAEEIAEAHGIRTDHVRARLRDLGYDEYGEPLPPPAPPARQKVVNFTRDNDESWRDDGECVTGGHDPDLWHPEGSGRSALYQQTITTAKAICAECPVRVKCLDAAMKAEGSVNRDGRDGIVGGLTPAERATLARSDREAVA